MAPFFIKKFAGSFVHDITDGYGCKHLLGVGTLTDYVDVLSGGTGLALIELGFGTDEVSFSQTIEVHVAVRAVGGTVKLVGVAVVFGSYVEHVVLPQRGGVP